MKEFERVVALAKARRWSLAEEVAHLGLTLLDKVEEASPDGLTAIVEYARKNLLIELELIGGGYGCLDLVLSVETDKCDQLANAIEEDANFQTLLNDFKVHYARVRIGRGERKFCGFYPVKFLLATNRKEGVPRREDTGLRRLFGEHEIGKLSFGVVTANVADMTLEQSRLSMGKRVWRSVASKFLDTRPGALTTFVQEIELVEEIKFRRLISEVPASNFLINIHGFANSFDDALDASAAITHRVKATDLGYVSILYSWPSIDSSIPVTYGADMITGQNSELALEEFLTLLIGDDRSKQITLLAHSHGNQILIRSLTALSAKWPSGHLFKKYILVEPDVDEAFFSQRASQLMSVCDTMTLYHSRNDRALALANAVFRSRKVGQNADVRGLAELQTCEVIDASHVAMGLFRHAPHIDCPEVVNDLHYLLRGDKASERFYLQAVEGSLGRWWVVPAKR